MNRVLLLLLIACAAGLGAYGITRQLAPAVVAVDELDWLRREFRLDEAQAREIERLHAAYGPVCAEHCAAVYDARAAVVAAQRDHGAGSPAHQTAQARLADLEIVCQTATRAHLEAVAAVMSPAEARRYLELVTPKVSQHEHARPFGLR